MYKIFITCQIFIKKKPYSIYIKILLFLSTVFLGGQYKRNNILRLETIHIAKKNDFYFLDKNIVFI